MADQNNSQPVTIKDAILQVKKWASEKNYEQVKQGCEEILQVDPDNKELKDLLEEAKKALNPQPVAGPAPVQTPVAPAPSPAAPAPVAAPVKPVTAPIAPAPATVTTTVTTTTVSAPAAPKAPAAQPSAADIFKKPSEPVKPAPVEPLKVEIVKKEEKKVTEKSGLTGEIITIAVFAAILGGFIYAFTQGWINPFYDWILGLFGL